MKPFMSQNTNLPYSNIFAYPIAPQIIGPNQFQYFPQTQQRMIYHYMPQPQIPNVYANNVNTQIANSINTQTAITQDSTSNKADSNNTTTPFKLLTKYKDIYVPTIYLLDYNDTTKSPFNLLATIQTQNQNYNQLQGQMVNNNNNQNNSILNKYFNYGYNLEQWKAYVNNLKKKFDELNDLVKNGNIRLPEPDNELEYLMAFPSDYGGLGNVRNDQKYENVKFYDPKDTTKNQANKNFMSLIRFDHDMTWFPLEPNPSSLNKPINDYKYLNFVNSYQNSCIPNIFIRNQNISNNISSTIISKTEQKSNIGNDSNNKNENDLNTKEK
jgi:hypothetical protein